MKRPTPKNTERRNSKHQNPLLYAIKNRPKIRKVSINRFLRIARIYFSRPVKVPKEDAQKQGSVVLQALKTLPAVDFDLKKSSSKMWHHLRLFLKPSIKPEAERQSRMSHLQAIAGMLSEDLNRWTGRVANFRERLLEVITAEWKTTAAALILLPFALELLLLFANLLTWSFLNAEHFFVRSFLKEKVILCIGDGFVPKSGDENYTQTLYRTLNPQKKQNWRILGFESPYLNTRLLMPSLPELLKQRPDYVYLMIGMNDLSENDPPSKRPSRAISSTELWKWSLSAIMFEDYSEHRSLRRTLQLLTAPPPLLTEWKSLRSNSKKLPIETNVTNLLKTKPASVNFPRSPWWDDEGVLQDFDRPTGLFSGKPVTITIRGNLYIEQQENQQRVFLWRVEGDKLFISGTELAQITTFTKTESPAHAQAQRKEQTAWNNLKLGIYPQAQKQFLDVLKMNPSSAVAHAGLAEIYASLGGHDKGSMEIDWLVQNYKAHPNFKNARALEYAYRFEHSARDSAKLALQLLQKYPDSPWFWQSLASFTSRMGDHKTAIAEARRAMELVPREMSALKASLLRTHAEITAELDSQIALKNLMEAFLLDKDADAFIHSVQDESWRYVNLNVERTLGQIQGSAEGKNQIRILLQQTLDPQIALRQEALTDRLIRIITECRKSGAEPVLVSAAPQSILNRLMKSIADKMEVSLLPLAVEGAAKTDRSPVPVLASDILHRR